MLLCKLKIYCKDGNKESLEINLISCFRPLNKSLIFIENKTGPRMQLSVTSVENLHYEEHCPFEAAIFSFSTESF